jgi:hypothetical protein
MTQTVRKLLIYLMLFAVFFSIVQSCKKKNDKLTISGLVYNTNENNTMKDVQVILFAQKISNGTFSSNYETIGSGTTGTDGKFSFTLDNIRVLSYRLTFNKFNYFDLIKDLRGDVVSKGGEYKKSYEIYPCAFLKLRIKNVSPYNAQDYMSYRLNFTEDKPTGFECCSDSVSTFHGKNIDIIRKCKTYGNQNIEINWNYTKHNITQIRTTNITCIPFDTSSVELFY